MDLPIIGEPLTDEEEKEVETGVKFLQDAGMSVKKIINYKDGSTKYVASYDSDRDQYRVRKRIERDGWKVGSPYYLNGSVYGFRVSKEGPASQTNVWGGT